MFKVLAFSKYASTSFAQRKPNGKLPILEDLNKIKILIADDDQNIIHPVSTLSLGMEVSLLQARVLPSALSLFADGRQQSLEMLSNTFGGRIFAYEKIAKCLSRSVSAFSRFMLEYLDSNDKADQCA